ncbi:MAG: HipA family kinase [Myxococcaceae bacterium]
MHRTLTATRYVTPLREGGSLPAIVEGDDDGLYVVKFRGAGQGPRVLVAELIAGELARALGLPVPEIVWIEIDPALGRNEPDTEIRELLKSSAGLNLALDYLPGSISFDPLAGPFPSAELASSIVWFDAFVLNVDRTPRNPNLLCWHRDLWLIDHGASLYFHHAWDSAEAATRSRFPMIKDHVLLPWASQLETVAPKLRARIERPLLEQIVSAIPETWLEGSQRFPDIAAHRAAYLDWLERRLASADAFVEEAIRAHAQLV